MISGLWEKEQFMELRTSDIKTHLIEREEESIDIAGYLGLEKELKRFKVTWVKDETIIQALMSAYMKE